MRIAFVSQFDLADPHAFSGTVRFGVGAVEAQGHEVVRVGPLRERWKRPLQARQLYHRLLRGEDHHRDREPRLLRSYARQVERALADAARGGRPVDAVLAMSTLPLTYVEADVPLVAWVDATFPLVEDFYPEFSNLSAATRRDGRRTEAAFLARCAAVLYSSEWAAASAVDAYGVDPARVHVVPYGANLDGPPTADAVAEAVAVRPAGEVRLLWIGVDWVRKGGDIAVGIAEALRARGVPADLTVVGAAPTGPVPDFVRPVGFVSKRDAAGRARLAALLARSHFLALPTRADCTPIVFNEACAYGLPVLTTDVGGIPSMIRDGENGFALSLGASPEAYAGRVVALFKGDGEGYRTLARSARVAYERRMNWDEAGRSVSALLERLTAGRPSRP